jgi:hypothetical protein
MLTRTLLLLSVVLLTPTLCANAAERIIFDTDIGGDIDDAGTMAVMHALADKGEIEILAVGVVNGHANTVPYTDAINTWYGRPELPLGTIKQGAPFARDTYMADVVRMYPHDLTKEAAPDVVTLYRKVLAAQPDRSVTLVAVGPATNISRLLESPADDHSPLNGVELLRTKLKFYAAGGNGNGGLPKGPCGWNYQQDLAAARDELAKLPVEFPTVFAGGSGGRLKIGNCYRESPPEHIIRKSYAAYFRGKDNMDRPTWDQLRMLYAARPASRRLFDTSAAGSIQLDDRGALSWTAAPQQNRAYAYVNDFDAMRTELTSLMLHKPKANAPPIAGNDAIFCDSFESADMSATDSHGFKWAGNNRTSIVVMAPGPKVVWHNGRRDEAGPEGADWTAHEGKHALRFRYPAGEAWTEQRFDLGRAYPEVWIRYWLRVPKNFVHGSGDPSNHKFFALWMDGYSQHGKGPTIVWNFWRQPDGNSRFSFSLSNVPEPKGHHGLADDFIVSPRDQGRWMQIVLYAKRSSSPEANDGAARIWRRWQGEDAFTLVSETVGRAFNPPSDGPQGWAAGYILGWANAAYAEDTEWLLDEFTVSNKNLLDDKTAIAEPAGRTAPANTRQ